MLAELEQLKTDALATYRAIVADLASGVEVDPGEVMHVAMMAGKDPASAATNAERLKARREAAANIARANELRAEHDALHAELSAGKNRWEIVGLGMNHPQLRALSEREIALRAPAEAFLIETADPAIMRRLRATDAERADLCGRKNMFTVADAEGRVKRARERLADAKKSRNALELREAEVSLRIIEGQVAAWQEAREDYAKLEKVRSAIEAERLDPEQMAWD